MHLLNSIADKEMHKSDITVNKILCHTLSSRSCVSCVKMYPEYEINMLLIIDAPSWKHA